MSQVFTAYIEFDPDTQLYVGTIPGLPGAHSQAPRSTNSTQISKKWLH